jgi:hypothetical protein
MTRIIIDDVESMQDLYDAVAVVARTFINPEKFASVEERFSKSAGTDCDCAECQPTDVGTREPIAAIASPMPYLPCPNRGTHLRLTDCWACWSDVHRGACLEIDVLAAEAWDIAVGELVTASQPRHRANAPAVLAETSYVGKHRADIVRGEVVGDEEVA